MILGSKRPGEASTGNFHGMGISESHWSQGHSVCKARLPPTDTPRAGWALSVLRYNEGAVGYPCSSNQSMCQSLKTQWK